MVFHQSVAVPFDRVSAELTHQFCLPRVAPSITSLIAISYLRRCGTIRFEPVDWHTFD